jgi:two-component system sensor histidine kinase DesK
VALGAAISLASGYPASSYLWVLLSAALTGVLTSYGAERRRIKDRLQQGEQAMAQLAVNEERLRFARDLHDLLGHSLSLLALKAQLAGRLVHNDPDACARQIAEMEEISRRALAEVRESVTGYRRPTLAVELARARTSLATAGIELRSDPALETQAADLEAPREAALAWALRESVTNVLRHAAGATTCAVRLRRAGGEDVLEIQDDGHATPGTPGNGLTGLGERLALEGGRVEAGASPSGGFRVRAYVPRALRSDPGHATTQGREELRDQPSTEVQGAGRG